MQVILCQLFQNTCACMFHMLNEILFHFFIGLGMKKLCHQGFDPLTFILLGIDHVPMSIQYNILIL